MGMSSPWLLAVLFSWFAIVFTSFGLFAPPNVTVIGTLFLCGLSVAGAIFLILAMYTPFQASDANLQRSAAQSPGASRPVAARFS